MRRLLSVTIETQAQYILFMHPHTDSDDAEVKEVLFYKGRLTKQENQYFECLQRRRRRRGKRGRGHFDEDLLNKCLVW